ncbi:hypothetical protein U1Q18_018965, partial [Sarracenia purpurea var. burkii]
MSIRSKHRFQSGKTVFGRRGGDKEIGGEAEIGRGWRAAARSATASVWRGEEEEGEAHGKGRATGGSSGGVADGGRWQGRLRDFCRDVPDLASVWCLAVDGVVAPA